MMRIYEIRANGADIDVTMEYVEQEWQDCYASCPEYAEYDKEWN